jgi:hypothetical protein
MQNLECGHCGIVFGVPDKWLAERKETKASWYCPNGHCRVFGKSTSDILKEESLELQAKLNAAEHARVVAERTRDKAIRDKRKLERRIAHGVCPCCNETFADVSHHMIQSHPHFRLPAGKETKLLTEAKQ